MRGQLQGLEGKEVSQSFLSEIQEFQDSMLLAKGLWIREFVQFWEWREGEIGNGLEISDLLAKRSREFLLAMEVLLAQQHRLFVKFREAGQRIGPGPLAVAQISLPERSPFLLVFEWAGFFHEDGGIDGAGLGTYLSNLIADLLLPDDFVMKKKDGSGELTTWSATSSHRCPDLPRLFQPVITEDFKIAANSFGVR